MIWFVVPAYNEAENIPVLLANLLPVARGLSARIVFVDDGSSDDTTPAIRRAAANSGVPVELVRHPTNQGVGVALNSGIRQVLLHADDDDAIITLESDNTSDLGDIPRLLERFDEGYDIVLASVYAPGGRIIGVSRLRLLASRAVSDTFRVLGRLRHIKTLSSLYRVYRVGTLRRAAETYGWLLVREPGFAASVELLLKLHNAGATISEIPTVNDWSKRQGQSKMRLWLTVKAYFRVTAAHLVGVIQPPAISPMRDEPEQIPVDTAAARRAEVHL